MLRRLTPARSSFVRGRERSLSSFPFCEDWRVIYLCGRLREGSANGAQILGLAERQDDSSMRVEGHLVLGYNLAFLRSLSLGLDHLEKGIANYGPDQHSHRLQPGHNPVVACYSTSALLLWMLGFPDQALQRTNEAVAVANRLNRPFSMAYALFHAGLLHLWRRELELVQERAEAVLEITEKHDFPIWEAVAGCLRGVALAGMGLMEEGLAQSDRSMNLYRGLRTPPVFWPLLLVIRAGLFGQADVPRKDWPWSTKRWGSLDRNPETHWRRSFAGSKGNCFSRGPPRT